MLADPGTFEPFAAGTFGGERTLVFGDGTGESGAAALLADAGVEGDFSAFAALLGREGPLTREEAVALDRAEFA